MIEVTLERIAVALESIAASRAVLMNGIAASIESEQPVQELPKEQPATTEQQANADAEHLTREFIKSELAKKGIKFKAAARTESLQKLLDEATKKEAPREELTEECPCLLEDREYGRTDTEELVWCKVCGKVISKKLLKVAAPAETKTSEPATIDQARTALIKLASSKGKNVALAVLKAVGKKDILKDVDPALYGALVIECEKQGAANGQ